MCLSLHQLTALDADPSELIDIARQLEVAAVCLFTHVPEAAAGRFPVVAEGDAVELRKRLDGAGVRLSNLEVFPLDREGRRDAFDRGLAIGAALGAERATAHIHAVSNGREAIDRFADFAELAAAHGIVAGLEFNHFSAVRDIASAERIVRGSGRGTIVLDMLHAVRSSALPEDVARVADLIAYAQLCDGPMNISSEDRWREAVGERLPPGEGEFALLELAKPLHGQVMFDVEVPQTSARKAGIPAIERARRAVLASRRLLSKLEEEHGR
jgi:sugar phosphate isomerase/epimerase